MSPETIPYFDDLPSFGHGLLGYVMTKVDPKVASLIFVGFIIYQMKEYEPMDSKFGDFAELATGYYLGQGLK